MNSPKYTFRDSNSLPWEKDASIDGVEFKPLGIANGQTMELCRYPPNTSYPAHVHKGPEFVFLLEGTARLAGQWLAPGWSSVGDSGTLDSDFLSGEEGCVFLVVYTA